MKLKTDNIKKSIKILKRKKAIPTHIVCNQKRYSELKKFKEYNKKTDTFLGLKFEIQRYCSSKYLFIMDYSERGCIKKYFGEW